MLKLPKILEESSPLIKQYRDLVISKVSAHNHMHKSNPSKYDWITSELLLVESINHELILKNLINFQIICRQKNIQPFYSYFFIKSLFMNKNLKVNSNSNLQQVTQKNLQTNSENPDRPLSGQVQKFLIDKIQSETNKIQTGSSSYHKIQNCISLRQQLLYHFFENSTHEPLNDIHQNANNLRYLNFQLMEIIKSWKNFLIQLQKKTFTGQNLPVSSLQTIEPIYVYQDQNYLCKIIYDNANIINTVNSKKNGNFISPPNPFFLSQDGNKQSMSQQEKQKIDQAMELIAKQKAFELKIMLDQPEYMSKNTDFRQTLRSSSTSRLKVQKSSTSYRKDDPFKQLFGSLAKLQIPEKKNNSIKEFRVENSAPKKDKYVSTSSRRVMVSNNDKVLTVYQARASKLRQQIQKNTETRDKFQTMVKKSQLQMLRDLRKKKTPPKQNFLKFTVEPKTFQERLKESPYKERISSLRREVEKNIEGVKLIKKEIPSKVQQLDESFLIFKTQNPIRRPIIQVKTTTPKIKLIQEKEVNIEKMPNPTIITQKDIDENNTKQKSLSRSKSKDKNTKSYSTFFKTPEEEQMQKSIIRESRLNGNKMTQSPTDKQRITSGKKKSTELNPFPTSSNFYKNKAADAQSDHGSIRKNSQPNIIKEKTVDKKNQETMRNNIDLSLKNLKERLRNIEIIKAYGKKNSSPHKRQTSHMSLSAIREDENVQRNHKISPNKKQHRQKNNRSTTFFQRQAQMLESKIEKLLQKQDKSSIFQKANGHIYEQDQQNREYESVNRLEQFNSERMSESESIFDENLRKLQKKEELIHQSNQMKQQQIDKTSKNKHKIEEQVNERRQRVRLMEEKITQMKQKRSTNLNHQEQNLKKSLLNESRQLIVRQQTTKVQQLKQNQQQIKQQNQTLRLLMIQEQQKFIKLKEEEYKMREELNRKKYLQELQQVKSQYLLKQQQYEQKILEQEKLRKENQIRLMKEKRQTQELQMKLHQQEMKELLLKEILHKEHQRWQKQSQQADIYHQQVKKMISTELQDKQEQEQEVNKIFLQENYKLMTLMNQMRDKNFKLEQANRIRLVQVEKTIKEKQEEIKKLEQLERQVQKMQNSRMSVMEQNQVQSMSLPITNQVYVPLQEEDLEDLKLRLKEEILKEMIERRKRQEEEELKFEEQRKKRLQILQNQIKDFLRKQGEISKVLEYARPEEIKSINVENILNRQLLLQNQAPIEPIARPIDSPKNQTKIAPRDPKTITTQSQSVEGQRTHKHEASSNPQNQYANSSLKYVLDSHSRPSPEKNPNSSSISKPTNNHQNLQRTDVIHSSTNNNYQLENQRFRKSSKKFHERTSQNNDQRFREKLEQPPINSLQKINLKSSTNLLNKNDYPANSTQLQSEIHEKSEQNIPSSDRNHGNFATQQDNDYVSNQTNQKKSPQQVKLRLSQSQRQTNPQRQSVNEPQRESINLKKESFLDNNQKQKSHSEKDKEQKRFSQITKQISGGYESKQKRNFSMQEKIPERDVDYRDETQEYQKIIQSNKLSENQGLNSYQNEYKIMKFKHQNETVNIKQQITYLEKPIKKDIHQQTQKTYNQVKKNQENQRVKNIFEKQKSESYKDQSVEVQNKTSFPTKNNINRSEKEYEHHNQQKQQYQHPVQKKSSKNQIVDENIQKTAKNLQIQTKVEKLQQISSAKNSLAKKFGEIIYVEEDTNKPADISKFQHSYVTVENPNETFDQSRSTKQKVFKSDEEMIQKFQALKQYLKMDAQFVTIEQSQIEDFLDKFYAAYPQEVQEMFSFTKSQLLTILKNHNSMQRKIDLFDCHSIGWYDRPSNKYILIGSLGCVHLIAYKYGEMQIEIAYVFDRANHKQKKFLVKQIKVFEKVGSMFQKKLEQENLYSLKLIIKITKNMIPEECHIPDELLHFNSLVSLQSSAQANSKIPLIQKHKLVFQHILADCMWQYMKKQQIHEYVSANAKDSIDLNVFAKSLQSYNEQEACKQLKDYIINEEEMTAELDMYFKLPYIQLGKRIHYQIKAEQYQLKNGERVYLSKHCQQTEDQDAFWKFLVFQTNKDILEDNFLETLLKAKVKQLNKLKPEREVDLVFPRFKINQSFGATQSERLKHNYRHKSLIDGDLIQSSISCANSTVEVERKLIILSKKSPELGFVFCACYAPGDQIQKLVAGSWVGYSDLIR